MPKMTRPVAYVPRAALNATARRARVLEEFIREEIVDAMECSLTVPGRIPPRDCPCLVCAATRVLNRLPKAAKV